MAMKHVIRIRAYLRTKLAQPYGKHKAGAEVAFNSNHKTKTLGEVMIISPDPVSLNLHNAQKHITESVKLKNELLQEKGFTTFSKKYTPEQLTALGVKNKDEILAVDPDAKFLTHFDQDKLYEFIQHGIDATTALITSVESFVNVVMPYDYIVSHTDKDGKVKVLNKDDIVRQYSIKDKIKLLGKLSGKSDYSQKSFWSSFELVKKVRDDLIHFKQAGKKFPEIWDSILVTLVDTDFEKASDDFVELIKYFRPEYFD